MIYRHLLTQWGIGGGLKTGGCYPPRKILGIHFVLIKSISPSMFLNLTGGKMEIARFVSFVVRLGLLLALLGQLKFCTLMLMGLASENSQKGIMSYSKYTKQLTGR